MNASWRFPKHRRLLTSSEFRNVVKRKPLSRDRHFRVHARRNDLGHARLGLTVSRRVDRRAVGRNRVKRLAREFFRNIPPGDRCLDVVVMARKGLDELDNKEVSTILQQQWQKLTRHASSMDPDNGRDN